MNHTTEVPELSTVSPFILLGVAGCRPATILQKSCQGSSSPWQATPNFLQKPITASTKTLRSSCGIDMYLRIGQRQSSKRCKKEMVPGLSCWLADHAGGEASEEQ